MQRMMRHGLIRDGLTESFVSAIRQKLQSWKASLQAEGIFTLSLFHHGRMVFIYLEAEERCSGDLIWPSPAEEFLEAWPGPDGPCRTAPMLDIFHYNRPSSREQWNEGRRPERRMGHLARLKPEEYASYVYYHYQLQEERPGSGNKTYMIGSFMNYIFSYHELPVVLEPAPYAGKLQTDLTPERWQEAMLPHFQLWPDAAEGELVWRRLTEICSL